MSMKMKSCLHVVLSYFRLFLANIFMTSATWYYWYYLLRVFAVVALAVIHLMNQIRLQDIHQDTTVYKLKNGF